MSRSVQSIDPYRNYRVREVSRLVPGRPHCQTVWRWVLAGVRGRKLASVLVGGRRYVPGQAILDFLEAEPTTSTKPQSKPTPTRTPAARRRASEAAARELERMGV